MSWATLAWPWESFGPVGSGFPELRWLAALHLGVVRHLPRVGSDHCLLLLALGDG